MNIRGFPYELSAKVPTKVNHALTLSLLVYRNFGPFMVHNYQVFPYAS